jgi:DNA-binding MarR family transcriptional regulator
VSSNRPRVRCPAGHDLERSHVVKVYHQEDGRLTFGRKSFTVAWRDWLLALRDTIAEELRMIDAGILQPPSDSPEYEPGPVDWLPPPMHLGVAEALRPLIGTMELGAQLPPASTLAVEFGVSRTTIIRAIKALTAMGLVRTVPRQGAFVVSHIGYDPERCEYLEVYELEFGGLSFGGTSSGHYRDWLLALTDAIDRKLAEIDAEYSSAQVPALPAERPCGRP